jgi:RimJ/RimL family protein N-acetyltransferase
MTIEIKTFESKYFDENLKLLNKGISESYFLARRKPITPFQSRTFMTMLANDPKAVYFLAVEGEKVVGHCYAIPRNEELLSHTASVGYLVDKEYRNKGICSKLMQAVITEVQKQNKLNVLFAEIIDDNTDSLRLIEKFGFKNTGVTPKGTKISEGEFRDLLLFTKILL